jgi:hypothetical protein
VVLGRRECDCLYILWYSEGQRLVLSWREFVCAIICVVLGYKVCDLVIYFVVLELTECEEAIKLVVLGCAECDWDIYFGIL